MVLCHLGQLLIVQPIFCFMVTDSLFSDWEYVTSEQDSSLVTNVNSRISIHLSGLLRQALKTLCVFLSPKSQGAFFLTRAFVHGDLPPLLYGKSPLVYYTAQS